MTPLERAARAVWDAVCTTNDEKSGGYVGAMRNKPYYVDGSVMPDTPDPPCRGCSCVWGRVRAYWPA